MVELLIPSLESLGLSGDRPLVLVDVDEVIGLFTHGFGRYLLEHDMELRIDSYALFQNIYQLGSGQHLAIAEGRKLFDVFFAERCHEIEAAPGAIDALNRLSRRAEIIILSNAPIAAERLRTQWLRDLGLQHPLILNVGPKGPIAAGLIEQTAHASAFVDDLISNLDSVAEHSPTTATFQHVADARLQPLAPAAPDRHPRIDDWGQLGEAIETAISRS